MSLFYSLPEMHSTNTNNNFKEDIGEGESEREYE